MFCSHCGKAVKENAEFCEHCGKPIKPGVEARKEPASAVTATSKQTSSVGGLVVMVVVVLLVAYWFANALDGAGGETSNSEDSKCQIAAKRWVDSWTGTLTLGPDDTLTYRYHLANNNGACYALVNYNFWAQDVTYTLADVYHNDPTGHPVQLGNYHFHDDNYSKPTLINCYVSGLSCSTLEEFFAMVKPYMEN